MEQFTIQGTGNTAEIDTTVTPNTIGGVCMDTFNVQVSFKIFLNYINCSNEMAIFLYVRPTPMTIFLPFADKTAVNTVRFYRNKFMRKSFKMKSFSSLYRNRYSSV